MHLMSCEHPKRVYNKYTDEYVWVPCGECNSCKNRRAKFYTDACERERASSAFTMFVTLTYRDTCLPVYNYTGGFDDVQNDKCDVLKSTRSHDLDMLFVNKSLFDDDADRDLFDYYINHQGIPYASKSDVQLFHKRLNKWFYNNVTHKYKNFRFFLVSELGSTTLRPHFHALYFVNDSDVARRFNEAVLACWRQGRCDIQLVENSACSYVAQYVNKLHDLPSFYKARPIRPFFLASRNPFIGTMYKYSQSDEEIFDGAVVQTFNYSKKDAKPVLVELDKSTENRLFPKCPNFGKVSDSLRVELYSIVCRIKGSNWSEFRTDAEKWLKCCDCKKCVFGSKNLELSNYLLHMVDNFSESGESWLRRLYYLSRKVYANALRFGVSIRTYVRKIEEYYIKKAQYLLKLMYDFQKEYIDTLYGDVSDIALMYPEYLKHCGFSLSAYLSQFTPFDVIGQREDAARYAYSNKRTHFKNMYLESLEHKNNPYFSQLKKFYYAKKRYEISEAFAS